MREREVGEEEGKMWKKGGGGGGEGGGREGEESGGGGEGREDWGGCVGGVRGESCFGIKVLIVAEGARGSGG